jgi:hypothetical protein
VAHEFAHAATAYSLGIPSTLFHFYANIDFATQEPMPRVWVAVAGPLFNLAFGLLCWLVYTKVRFQPARLSWLYHSIMGIGMFLSNLFSTAFTGDFGTAAMLLNLTPNVRAVITITGLALMAWFLSSMGRELVKWAPPHSSRTSAILKMIAWPVVLGSILSILAFLPLPPEFIAAWLAASMFWIFALAGGLLASTYAAGSDLRMRPFEYVAAVAVLAMIRLLTSGARLAP